MPGTDEFRYVVERVHPDGNPYEVCRSKSAIAALDVVESYPRSRTAVTFAYDSDDPETGSLHDAHPAVEREWDERAEAAGFDPGTDIFNGTATGYGTVGGMTREERLND
jgi:hypothetical protein